MNKNKLLYKLNILFVIISIVGFIGFLITALIVREKQAEHLVSFLVAGIFLLLSILSIFLIIKFTQSESYKEIIQFTKKQNLEKVKDKKKKKLYRLSKDIGFQDLLESFDHKDLDEYLLFYRTNKSVYNKKKKFL